MDYVETWRSDNDMDLSNVEWDSFIHPGFWVGFILHDLIRLEPEVNLFLGTFDRITAMAHVTENIQQWPMAHVTENIQQSPLTWQETSLLWHTLLKHKSHLIRSEPQADDHFLDTLYSTTVLKCTHPKHTPVDNGLEPQLDLFLGTPTASLPRHMLLMTIVSFSLLSISIYAYSNF